MMRQMTDNNPVYLSLGWEFKQCFTCHEINSLWGTLFFYYQRKKNKSLLTQAKATLNIKHKPKPKQSNPPGPDLSYFKSFLTKLKTEMNCPGACFPLFSSFSALITQANVINWQPVILNNFLESWALHLAECRKTKDTITISQNKLASNITFWLQFLFLPPRN